MGDSRFYSLAALLLGLLILATACSDEETTAPPVPKAPQILGQDATNVDHHSATLGGWVNGRGRETVCWFDYSTDNTFGARTPDIANAITSGPARVQYDLAQLDEARLYSWRLVVVAGGDTVFGPDTTLTTLPAPNEEPLTQTIHAPLGANRYHFYWTGSDPDGVVRGFRWRMSDNGLDNGIDVADTLGLPWHYTTSTDSVFDVSADQPGVTPDPNGTGRPRFAQNHTFWVKAVDNRGDEDSTPAMITFTAITEAPEVAVELAPVAGPLPAGCLERTLPTAFVWTASDPDGQPDAKLWVRTLLISFADLNLTTCLSENEYAALDPLAAVAESRWSQWQEYDPQIFTPNAVNLGPEHEGGRYFFAAMARDNAGAWTQKLALGVNVWQVEVLPD